MQNIVSEINSLKLMASGIDLTKDGSVLYFVEEILSKPNLSKVISVSFEMFYDLCINNSDPESSFNEDALLFKINKEYPGMELKLKRLVVNLIKKYLKHSKEALSIMKNVMQDQKADAKTLTKRTLARYISKYGVGLFLEP